MDFARLPDQGTPSMPLRVAPLLGLLLLTGCLWSADNSVSRHGIAPDCKSYPQATPKETLGSVLKAVELKRFDYLVAQLTDPADIDARVEALAGGFKEVVKEASEKLDAPAVKKLARFLEAGEFETLENNAVVRLKDVPNRVVRLRKINKRWYLQNSSKP
jgi:hypothetical protein